MSDRFGVGSKLHVLTNGYDPEELEEIRPVDFRHFAIVYTGGFYPPKRVITPVMAALKHLAEANPESSKHWRFHYYGTQETHVREEARRFGVLEHVILHGRVSRVEALSALRGAAAAVVITSVSKESIQRDNGIITGKVFEPLGLKTPILLIAPPGSDATEIVEATGMGRRITGTDIEGIAQFFLDCARCRDRAHMRCSQYSWPILSSRLDSILRASIAQRHTPEVAVPGGSFTTIPQEPVRQVASADAAHVLNE
jgi:glycosyltransferase involved in cell wall biosynthesis